MSTDVLICPIAEEYIEGFHRCLDNVARERRYLGFLQAPPLESTRGFVLSNPAIHLYKKFGFTIEGTRKRARKLDGIYDDIVEMVLFF